MDPVKLIEEVFARLMANVIFRATVTDVSGTTVKIKRVGQPQADGRFYKTLVSYTTPTAADDVLCIGALGTVIVIGELA